MCMSCFWVDLEMMCGWWLRWHGMMWMRPICPPPIFLSTKPVWGLDITKSPHGFDAYEIPNHSVDVWKGHEVHRERPQTPCPDWSWQAMENIWNHMKTYDEMGCLLGCLRENLDLQAWVSFPLNYLTFCSGRALFREWFLHFILYLYMHIILIYHTSNIFHGICNYFAFKITQSTWTQAKLVCLSSEIKPNCSNSNL